MIKTMTKRANPFNDDFIPQSKVHIGSKQFNNNEDRLKKVYEKTLELLYQGAKKLTVPDSLNNNDVHFVKKDQKMKQMFIGIDGSLLRSGCLVAPKATKVCRCGVPIESQCAYCEMALCSTCQHGCERCENAYCACCVLVGSEGSEVCVSCYS